MLNSNVVLIIGSAPDVTSIKHWDLSLFTSCVVINNAWRVTEHWNYLIFPEDFPIDRRPQKPLDVNQHLITAPVFVPHQNSFGGFVYAGGTMAFTAGYWALGALKPDIIAYVGCDMVYSSESGKTSHFYGSGSADPLRNDLTLQSLEAKSNRFMAIANINNCAVLNMSTLEKSRLTFPRQTYCRDLISMSQKELLATQKSSIDLNIVDEALTAEKNLGYLVPSGRYWESQNRFDPHQLRLIDDIWLKALKQTEFAHF